MAVLGPCGGFQHDVFSSVRWRTVRSPASRHALAHRMCSASLCATCCMRLASALSTCYDRSMYRCFVGADMFCLLVSFLHQPRDSWTPCREDIQLELTGWEEAEGELRTRWRFNAILQLPWRPRLAAAGGTTHVFSPVRAHAGSREADLATVAEAILALATPLTPLGAQAQSCNACMRQAVRRTGGEAHRGMHTKPGHPTLLLSSSKAFPAESIVP